MIIIVDNVQQVCNQFPMGSRPSTKLLEELAINTGHYRRVAGKIFFTVEDVHALIATLAPSAKTAQ